MNAKSESTRVEVGDDQMTRLYSHMLTSQRRTTNYTKEDLKMLKYLMKLWEIKDDRGS